MTMGCSKCNGTGSIETGNNDLPCDCRAGNSSQFNVAGVKGTVTGAEVKRHFLKDSPHRLPRKKGNLNAEDLPGRNDNENCSLGGEDDWAHGDD
jgi:hypothetical protein